MSRCVSGPFDPGVLITEIGTVLHEAFKAINGSSLRTNNVAISGSTRVIGVSKAPIRLDCGRFRLLACFVRGRKVTLSERGVLGGM